MVVRAGFEPAYSERTDLQSVAFNHSATSPSFFQSEPHTNKEDSLFEPDIQLKQENELEPTVGIEPTTY